MSRSTNYRNVYVSVPAGEKSVGLLPIQINVGLQYLLSFVKKGVYMSSVDSQLYK